MLTTPENVTLALALIERSPPRSMLPEKDSVPSLVWSPKMRSPEATTLLARVRLLELSLLREP